MLDARRDRRSLADLLDFSCFIAIAVMHVVGLLLIAAIVYSGWVGGVGLLLAASPLALWLAALIGLRRYLERSHHIRWQWRWDLHEPRQESPDDTPKAA